MARDRAWERLSRAICDAAPDRGWVVHATQVSFERWAERFLREMKVPRCRNNKVVVLAWEANENTDAVFNPLATTRDMPGSWDFNSVGVQNYISLAQGLDGSRLTIENGYEIYGYGAIVRRLDRCSKPMSTARAIRDSRWCFGCSGGAYVTGVVPSVRHDFGAYADRTSRPPRDLPPWSRGQVGASTKPSRRFASSTGLLSATQWPPSIIRRLRSRGARS